MYSGVHSHVAWKSVPCHILEIYCDFFNFANFCDLKLTHILGPYANETFTEMSLEYKHLLRMYLLLWIQ